MSFLTFSSLLRRSHEKWDIYGTGPVYRVTITISILTDRKHLDFLMKVFVPSTFEFKERYIVETICSISFCIYFVQIQQSELQQK